MRVCTVIGRVVSTVKHPALQGRTILAVVDEKKGRDPKNPLDLAIDGGVATVQRTEDAPVAMADISSWGTLMLGGGDATHLALSGRLQGDPNVVNSCFRTSHEPWNDVDF